MSFRSTNRPAYAPGFPTTDAVSARRLRAKHDVLARRGDIVLVNGTNAFTIDLDPFKKVSVEAEEGGVFSIVGHESAVTDSPGKALARFGSEEGAKNGYAALIRAHSGAKVHAGGGSKLKWAGGMVALFFAVFVVMVAIAPGDQNAAVAAAPSGFSPQAQQVAQAPQPPQMAGFNPNEPSLEELAAGNYKFQPQLKAPNVAAPTLNCAPRN